MLRTEPSQLKQDTFRDVCALYLNSEAKSETKQWSHSEVIHETTHKTLTDVQQIKGQIYIKCLGATLLCVSAQLHSKINLFHIKV